MPDINNNYPQLDLPPAPAKPIPVAQQEKLRAESVANDLRNRITSRLNKNAEGREIVEELFTCKVKDRQIVADLYFWFENDIEKAQLAAREYCLRFGYRFIWIKPFCIDINEKPKFRGEVPMEFESGNVTYK